MSNNTWRCLRTLTEDVNHQFCLAFNNWDLANEVPEPTPAHMEFYDLKTDPW